MTANYLAENDMLQEAGAILRGGTRKIATQEHLEAMKRLVVVGEDIIKKASWGLKVDPARFEDWLREAAKAIGPTESSTSR